METHMKIEIEITNEDAELLKKLIDLVGIDKMRFISQPSLNAPTYRVLPEGYKRPPEVSATGGRVD